MTRDEWLNKCHEIINGIGFEPTPEYLYLTDFAHIGFFGNSHAYLKGYVNRFASHADASVLIHQLEKFYEAVTEEELKILNLTTLKCNSCHQALTIDEFHEVNNSNGIARVHRDGSTGICHSWYCKSCSSNILIGNEPPGSVPGFVYLAVIGDLHKLGRSINPDRRMKTIPKIDGDSAQLIAMIRTPDSVEAERIIQSAYFHRHVSSEFFNLSSDEVDHIKGLENV